ncbi:MULTISPECIES: arginine deiminase-related protein [Dyella]|uniref:Amidinotransferase n=2 Tax=Dyella TaxID=231454 RepID=A0A4R0YQ08_9GAMM|nr:MULTISPECIES: arginine deiminase-related protein [Dyella]TBR36784.1 amidinotransferase [Dyella terrae]TCI08125.1 amidinotransferase [Dyella soli]
MFVTDATTFLDAWRQLDTTPFGLATAQAAFLVSPAEFSLATESAQDNAYMAMQSSTDPLRALAQHAALAQALRTDLPVVTFPGHPATPDALFPNNVFATAPGTLVVGRMRHAIRRTEAERGDIRSFFRNVLGYTEIDLSSRDDLVAELTGSMVIDRARGVGFCGLSERCDEAGARAMHEAFGLRMTFCFRLAPGEYHTNVVLAVLAGRAAIIAKDGFASVDVPDAIAEAYAPHVVQLDAAQKRAYAGNAIALSSERVWMSDTAGRSLENAQRALLECAGFRIGTVPLDEIEKAGGSLRCCIAEIF